MRRARLEDFFAAHDLRADSILLIHSSFRGLSAKGWTPEALIEGILEGLPRGTLLMPAMSWRLVNAANPVFDELKTPSITGVLTEIFRTRYATHRSLHPTHSVAGIGPAAEALLSRHHLDETPVSDNSPHGLMAKAGARVLLLGVEMDSCTLVHHAEEKIAPELYLRPEVETYLGRFRDGREIPLKVRRHLKLSRNFWQFETRLAERGLVRYGDLDGIAVRSFPAGEMDALILDHLRADPTGTMAKPGERSKLM